MRNEEFRNYLEHYEFFKMNENNLQNTFKKIFFIILSK